ncbi:anaphase promoting complex subunit 1 [Sporobolomyces koalae]|uniref:anaphase promoting complex subunit 1 n=1 Tax=Sporobolomyces koalae TaxID=500713 RepID=UPI00316E88F8
MVVRVSRATRLDHQIEPTTTFSSPPSLARLYNLPTNLFNDNESTIVTDNKGRSRTLKETLIATSRQLDAPSLPTRTGTNTKQKNRIFVPQDLVPQGSRGSLHQLSWSGSTVEWISSHPNPSGLSSRARTTIEMKWNHDRVGQPIEHVCFVRFEQPEPEPGSSQPRTTVDRFPLSEHDVPLWGPYRTRLGQRQGEGKKEWSDEALKLPLDPPIPSSSSPRPAATASNRKQLDSYLLIVLKTLAFLHPISPASAPTSTATPTSSSSRQQEEQGGIPLHLPFKVARVFPLEQGGILFERAREGLKEVFPYDDRTTTTELDPGSPSNTIPTWWILNERDGVYGELKPCRVAAARNDSQTLASESNDQTMQDLDERFVFVSTHDHRRRGFRIAVSVHEPDRKVKVWQYDSVQKESTSPTLEPFDSGTATAHTGEGDLGSTGATTPVPTSRTRRPRRSVRLSLSQHHDPNETSLELGTSMSNDHHHLRHHNTSGSRRTNLAMTTDPLVMLNSLSPPICKDVEPMYRRTSLTRNDLSVTMDRMALSQGSSVGGVVPPTLSTTPGRGGAGGDLLLSMMDREATMYLGEDEWVDKNHHVRSPGVEIDSTFTCIWQGDLEPGVDSKDIKVCLFDQTRSNREATLAIHLPSTNRVLILSLTSDEVNRHDGSSSTSTSSTLPKTKCEPIKQLNAIDICPVIATRPNVQDLLMVNERGQSELVAMRGMSLGPLSTEAITAHESTGIESDGGSNIVLANHKSFVQLEFEMDPLGQTVLETIAQVYDSDRFESFLSKVMLQTRNETGRGYDRVKAVLESTYGFGHDLTGSTITKRSSSSPDPFLSRLRRSNTHTAQTPSRPATSGGNVELVPADFSILYALHLVVQSLRLRISTSRDAFKLARLVAKIAAAVGAKGWLDEYIRTWGPHVARFPLNQGSASPWLGLLPKIPPNIFNHLFNILSYRLPPDSSSFSIEFINKLFSISNACLYYGETSQPLSVLTDMIRIYSDMSPASTTATSASATERAHRTIMQIHGLGWTRATLKDVPVGIVLPIREAIRTCQLDPPEPDGDESREGMWELIGRRELEPMPNKKVWSNQSHGRQRTRERIESFDMDALAQEVEQCVASGTAEATRSDRLSTRDRSALAHVPLAARFNEDKRLEEVARMLQFVEPVVIAPGEKTLDQLTPQVQQSILSALSHRTFALPIGAAMYHLSSLSSPTSLSDTLDVPKVNTSARIVPMSSPVGLVEKERDPAAAAVPDRAEWPDFHSGVATALRLGTDATTPMDASQLSFNRPAELDARHAGLLLGLGLNGHLGSMLSSQAYEYLKAKHDPTSVAILLGLAVTYLGTSDPTVTSVISIHLPALHPPRSSSLNVSGMTKSAAAVALGLLHFGTARRSLADVMVRELCAIRITTVEDAAASREAYALSCGFSFGFIMLGRGNRASTSDANTSASEVDLLRVFRALILGEHSKPLPGAFYSATSASAPIDVNITSSAATIALALMFIRSERQDVADIFEIPDSPCRLDYVRSDVLLLRSLARSLVMWNSVTPTKEWIESTLPAFLADIDPISGTRSNLKTVDPELHVARWSIIAGACFAAGFKFAGTATAEAHATLIHYMDRLTRACYAKAATVEAKIKRHSLRTCLGAVSIALAMVMAGTGELNVLRRLRVAHGHLSEGLTYGYHLSTHMALGLLFLGEAKYTLSNSNGAIATLLLALFPIFPAHSTDNRAHLQAYRHLWALAAEPRYLEARDIDSNEPVFLPVRLRLADLSDGRSGKPQSKIEVKAKQLVAPTLIPDLRSLDSIQVESPRYWGFTLRLASNPAQFERFLRDSTLYVKRRTGHLSYAQDPRGIRSIFTRSKSETGSSVYDFGETARMLNPSSSGLRDFVAAFSDDVEAIAATQHLCVPLESERSPSAFEAFCASVLLECLTKDKRDITHVYHSIFHSHSILSRTQIEPWSSEHLVAAEQLELVVEFYHRGIFKSLFASRSRSTSSTSGSSSTTSSSSSREPLLNSAFIDHVSNTLASHLKGSPSSLNRYLEGPESTFSNLDPTFDSEQTRLAFEIRSEGVPDVAALVQLRRSVRTARDEGAGPQEVELILQRTAKTLELEGKKSWSRRVSTLLSRLTN